MSVKIEYATVAQCGPQHIWQVFQEIERWPRWDPEAIRHIRWLTGEPWSKGSRFEISLNKPLNYTLAPEILDIDPPIFLHWRGKGGGITGEQFFIFRPLDGASTEMRTLQEYSGAPMMLMGKRVRQPIIDGVQTMFGRIKQEAEEIAARLSDPPLGV